MSDELIEGRSLRDRAPEPPPEAKPAAAGRKSTRLKAGKQPKAEDEKSGPYVTLVPPDEAGDPIRAQTEQPTFHKGLKPVIDDDSPRRGRKARPQQAEEPATSAPADEPSTPAPDLPWDVIEAAQPPEPEGEPIMKLPRVPTSEPAPPEAAIPPAPPAKKAEAADLIPHFHTLTGELPPVKRDDADYIPHFHTPTGEMQPVPDEPAKPGVEPLDEQDIPPIRRAGDSATPGILRRVPGDDDEDDIPPIRRGSDSGEMKAARRRARRMDDTRDEGKPLALEDDSQGGLPRLRPMSDEPSGEVVDADWVREVGQEQAVRRERTRNIEEAIAEKLEVRRAQAKRQAGFRLNARTILTAISILALIALAIYIPWRLGLFSRKSPPVTPAPAATPTVVQPTSAPASGGTQAPGAPLAAYPHGRLAFASNRDGNYELYVMDMSTGAATRLTTNTTADRSPAWSPDGRQVVYVSNMSGNDDLVVIPATGGTPVALTTDPGSDRNPAWSPDGRQIVFTRETVDGSRLMSLPADCIPQPSTCEKTLKLLTPGGYDRFPTWSPSGAKLAFTAADLPGNASTIALLNADGSGYAALAGTRTSDLSPAWSPDGKRIAFLSYAEGDYNLWLMNADSSGVTQITKSQATDGAPGWSPDGGYIVFASDRADKQHFNLYLILAACPTPDSGCESSLIRVTDGTADDLDPAWTPY